MMSHGGDLFWIQATSHRTTGVCLCTLVNAGFFSFCSRCFNNLHTGMLVLSGGGCVAKSIRMFVEGKPPPFPETVSPTSADTSRAHEHSLAKQGLLLGFCAGGLLTSYLIWGLLQERIMAYNYGEAEGTSERFTNSQFLVFMNRIFALCVAGLVTLVQQQRHSAHQPPLYKYSYCSFSNIISSWCQYEALKFVSFPVQVSVHVHHCAFTVPRN